MEDESSTSESYVREVLYDGAELPAGELAPHAEVLTDLPALDGRVSFIKQGADPMLGVLASGDSARRATDHLLDVYRATPLEVFTHFSSQEQTPPAELVRNHRFWIGRQGRPFEEEPHRFPSTDQLLAESAGVGAPGSDCKEESGGKCWEWFTDAAACGADDLGLFDFWFNDYNNYDSYGANETSGSGEWEGSANVTLGPSSRGLVVACGHSESAHYALRFEVFVQGLGWVLVHTTTTANAFAHGYRYRGFSINQLRMTVRPVTAGTTPRFFWAASY